MMRVRTPNGGCAYTTRTPSAVDERWQCHCQTHGETSAQVWTGSHARACGLRKVGTNKNFFSVQRRSQRTSPRGARSPITYTNPKPCKTNTQTVDTWHLAIGPSRGKTWRPHRRTMPRCSRSTALTAHQPNHNTDTHTIIAQTRAIARGKPGPRTLHTLHPPSPGKACRNMHRPNTPHLSRLQTYPTSSHQATATAGCTSTANPFTP